jgi:hypothetical protein
MAILTSHTRDRNLRQALARVPSAALFLAMILGALIFFEVFNFSTTNYALTDLLGSLRFAGIPWATILALAFCAIDFAGIARLLSPSQTKAEPHETWYLFGAWLIAATMNAALTWWGVSMAIVNHTVQSTAVISTGTLLKVIPVFVAILVWVIRILIIGSISYTLRRVLGKTTREGASSAAPARSVGFNTAVRPASSHTAPSGYQKAILTPLNDQTEARYSGFDEN